MQAELEAYGQRSGEAGVYTRVEAHTTPDGDELAVQWYGRPETSRAVFLFLPALGVRVRYYAELGRKAADLGYSVAIVPFRGERSSIAETRRRRYGYHEILEVDVPQLLGKVRAAAGGKPVILAGHSLGGQVALLAASRRPEGIHGVVLLAGGSNYYGSLPPAQRLKRGASVRFVRIVDQLLGFFPGDKLGFGGRQPKKLILDWTHEAIHGAYRFEGDTSDPERDLASLSAPVLFVSLTNDKLVPRSCAEYLAAKLKNARVQIEELAPDAFAGRVDHFRWAKEPAPVLATVDRWAAAGLPS
jgi:predicted alpha/beta hydrolase